MTRMTNDGARAYTRLTLKLYDWWVLNISNQLAWRCLTDKYLIPHFTGNTGEKHLDVGVGTGYYLTYAPERCTISLMDLNSSSLTAASTRAGQHRIQDILQHDVFEPWPGICHNRFDSISMFYLLHCLPGTMQEKNVVIRNAAMALTENGTLFGATILGKGVRHNAFGRKLMNIYNAKGIFSNRDDSEAELHAILSEHFGKVNVVVQGTVALFSATEKR